MPRSTSDGTGFDCVAVIAGGCEAFAGTTPSSNFKDVAKPPISEAAQIKASNHFSFSIIFDVLGFIYVENTKP